MIAYVIRRLLLLVPVALFVSFITFMLIHLVPGDPARVLLGEDSTPEAVAALHQQLGLDRPLYEQYALWLNQAIHGNLGQSIQLHQPVLEAITQRLPVTVELGVAALLFSLVLAVPLGMTAATRRDSRLDWLLNVGSLLGTTIPPFVLGLLLILVFAVLLRMFPPGGYVPFTEDPLENLRDLILPMIALGSASVAVNFRQVRSGMLDVLGQDYIRTARAKGLSERRVNYRHALPNALLPLLTLVGLQAGAILAGAVVVETIFLWPGVGQLAVTSILSKDYPVVQGVVLLSALSYILINLLVDLSYTFVDPRITYGAQR
jgi:ABC-type dipeptide/oligopeptide/nickel transport system permease component